MDLQLGLALPITGLNKGFDLNFNFDEPKEVVGSCMARTEINDHDDDGKYKKRKCSFGGEIEDDFDELDRVLPLTLPLLLWNNNNNNNQHPNDEDDGFHGNSSFTINKNDESGNGIVGWPPLKTWRKKLYHHNGGAANNPTVENNYYGIGGGGGGGRGRGGSNSKYVKVKMEGVGIARKIDLSRHHSYETLIGTLINMFGKCQETVKNYELAYQNREGDWLLVSDLLWRNFIESVQRLKLSKKIG